MVARGEDASTFQQWAYRAVAPHAWPSGVSPFNKLALFLIVLASLFAIIETEEGLVAEASGLFLGDFALSRHARLSQAIGRVMSSRRSAGSSGYFSPVAQLNSTTRSSGDTRVSASATFQAA